MTVNKRAMLVVVFIMLHLDAYPVDEAWKDPELKDIEIRLEPVPGSYYESEIPATLELVERAELCIRSMTRLVNPDYDYAQYSYVILHHDPPYKAMESGITNLNPKWLEALPLLRIMSGSRLNVDIDARMIEGGSAQYGI